MAKQHDWVWHSNPHNSDNTDKRAPVSVVIPCYCCSNTIGRALASVAAQTMLPHEVLLVEDSSPDGRKTLDALHHLVARYGDIFAVKIIVLKENSGAASARNAGWAIATQPYIAFLDSDDAWHPRKIEIQYAYMAAHPEVTLSGHLYRVIKQPEKLPDWEVGQWRVKQLSRLTMLMSNRLITPSVMLKKNVPHRFLAGKRHVDDHLLWLELICEGHKMVLFSAELASVYKFLYGAGGLSSQLWLMEKGELENYARLYSSGCINLVEWLILGLYSLLKYVRRLVIYWLYLRRGK